MTPVDRENQLLQKQRRARIYFDQSVLRRAHNMRIKAHFNFLIKSCGRVAQL